MPSIPPTHGPWRNPYEGRRFVTLRRTDPGGLYEVTVSPGAELRDIVDVTATMPSVVYLDHRPAEPRDATVILTFRSIPPNATTRPYDPCPPETSGRTPANPPTHGEFDILGFLKRNIRIL